MNQVNDSTVSLEILDTTISACSWLVDVAEKAAAAGSVDAAAAARWLDNLGSHCHCVRHVRQMNPMYQVSGVLQ